MEATTSLLILKALTGNEPASLNSFQEFLAPHVDTLAAAWFATWTMTAVFLLVHLAREYSRQRSDKKPQ